MKYSSPALELARSLNAEVRGYRSIAESGNSTPNTAHGVVETPYQKQLRANRMVLRAKLSDIEKMLR